MSELSHAIASFERQTIYTLRVKSSHKRKCTFTRASLIAYKQIAVVVRNNLKEAHFYPLYLGGAQKHNPGTTPCL